MCGSRTGEPLQICAYEDDRMQQFRGMEHGCQAAEAFVHHDQSS
ncbi:MAG: hypothetical protein QOH35_48, partial [Acidobacteriaceae bacterium]|nr:hypothetical protein [Acidobacteriaceae bacterium]